MKMSTYCRICQIKSENEVNIFEIYQDKYDLTEIIYELSQIELNANNHPPIYICSLCAGKLVDCHLFRQRLLESQIHLDQLTDKDANICPTFVEPVQDNTVFVDDFHADNVVNGTNDYNDDDAISWDNVNDEQKNVTFFESLEYKTNQLNDNDGDSELQYTCKRCQKSFENPDIFLNHLHTSHPDGASEILKANHSKSLIFSNFYGHLRMIRNMQNNLQLKRRTRQNQSIKKYICDECQREFYSADAFLYHFKRIHIQLKYKPSALQNKCVVESQNENDKNPFNSFICPVCKKNSTTMSNFRRHLRRVHNMDQDVELFVRSRAIQKYECDVCSTIFHQRNTFEKHFKRNHSTFICDESLDLRCPTCSLKFSSQNRLNRHLEISHGIISPIESKETQKGIECSICYKVYSTMSNLRKHRYEVHCISETLKPNEDRMRQRQSKKMEFNCEMCSKQMSNSSNLYRHLRSIHGISDNNVLYPADANKKYVAAMKASSSLYDESSNQKFECKRCDRLYDNSKKFFQHFQYNHMRIGEEKIKRCPYCVKKFLFTKPGAYATLKRHIQKHHQNENKLSDDEDVLVDMMQCSECDQQFVEIFDMYQHFKIHDHQNKDNEEGYNLQCDLCNIQCETINEYYTHNQTVHNIQDKELIKPIKCRWCGERYRKFNGFSMHLRSTHHRSKLHSSDAGNRNREAENKSRLCPICGKLMLSSASLSGHMETHREEEIFQCHLCPKKFRTTNSLNSHIMVHKAERKHSCHICTKAFKTRAHLKRHLFVHGINVVFHECQVCGKKFNRDSNLRIHMWVHREGYPFNCRVCGRGFARKNKMNAHVEAEHPTNAAVADTDQQNS